MDPFLPLAKAIDVYLFGCNKASNIFHFLLYFPHPSLLFSTPLPCPVAIKMALDSDCASKEHMENLRLLSCGEIDKILKIKTKDDVNLKNSSVLNISF